MTLASRLALGGLAWIGLWAAALLLLFNVLLSNVLSGQIDTALEARAEAVSATVRVHDGKVSVLDRGDDSALDAGTVIYQGTAVVEGEPLPTGLLELVGHGSVTVDRELLGPVRYLAAPIRAGGTQVGTVVVSSDTGQLDRTVKVVAAASVMFLLLMVVFTFFALQATVRLALRPVRVMGDQASAWSDQHLDRRFDPAAGPLELRDLAGTLNALLERISASLRHERDFTAGLAHELRTPLAHLHAEVDLLEPEAVPERTALMTSVRRLESLVESALSPARTSGSPGLSRVADVLAGLDVPVAGRTDLLLAVDADIARRAVLPVLENATRYAVSEVRIDVGLAGGTAHISVTDDGGRLDPALVEDVFRPGFRGDPDDGYPGAGLGLALTRRIARAAGGDATAAAGPGRTTVTITLPCVTPPDAAGV